MLHPSLSASKSISTPSYLIHLHPGSPLSTPFPSPSLTSITPSSSTSPALRMMKILVCMIWRGMLLKLVQHRAELQLGLIRWLSCREMMQSPLVCKVRFLLFFLQLQQTYHDLLGTRIGRLRVIFKLPDKLFGGIIPSPALWPKSPLAYVEWFTPLRPSAHPDHNMYAVRTSPLSSEGRRPGAIVPLSSIRQSCMLTPAFGRQVDRDWTSDNVLDLCTSFLVNNWASKYAYQTIW